MDALLVGGKCPEKTVEKEIGYLWDCFSVQATLSLAVGNRRS